MRGHMRKYALQLCVLLVFAGCGDGSTSMQGGTGAGNPTAFRTVKGVVPANEFQALSISVGDTCVANKVIATNQEGTLISASTDEICAFELELPIQDVYHIKLNLDVEDIAQLEFQNDPKSLPSPVIIISDGDQEIDLGQISIDGHIATPEFEPALQSDQDNDGINDFDDTDDDNDGTPDCEESDSDLDGILDDYDIDDEYKDVIDGDFRFAKVLQVLPCNGDGIDLGTIAVDRDTIIQIRTNCHIIDNSVNEFSFRVEAESESVHCNLVFFNNSKIECHPKQLLTADTLYTVTLQGLQCNDGRFLKTISWSWQTE